MPRFYSHFRDVGGLDPDQDGLDLPTFTQAEAEARRMAHELREVWSDLPLSDLNRMAIEVADESGQTVLVVSFAEAVEENH